MQYVQAGVEAAKRENRRAQSESRKRKQETERVEREIESRETELRALETELADPSVYAARDRAKELLARYERIKGEVESLWRDLERLLPDGADRGSGT